MLNSRGLNLSVRRGRAFWTCLKSVGAPICGRRGPLYAFNFLLTEKLPRLDARDAKLLVLDIHSCDEDLLCCGSGIGGGMRRG